MLSTCMIASLTVLQHFSTNSPLFKDHQRRGVAISNLGLTVMSCILIEYSRAVGGWAFFKLYFVPYLVSITLPMMDRT